MKGKGPSLIHSGSGVARGGQKGHLPSYFFLE